MRIAVTAIIECESYSAGLGADYWRVGESWGSAAYVLKGADWVGVPKE
jgi:hypothetical protein